MILVTGASGNIGSEVVKQLAAQGVTFRAAARGGKLPAASAGVQAVDIDYTKAESVRAALKGVDTLFLLVPSTPNQAELDALVATEAKRA